MAVAAPMPRLPPVTSTTFPIAPPGWTTGLGYAPIRTKPARKETRGKHRRLLPRDHEPVDLPGPRALRTHRARGWRAGAHAAHGPGPGVPGERRPAARQAAAATPRVPAARVAALRRPAGLAPEPGAQVLPGRR